MIVAFSSIDAVPAALATFQPDAVCSIFSPRWPVSRIEDRPHLGVIVHDVERPSIETCGKIVPDARHVGAFLDFIDDHQPERLLIHCRAGLSRSPAFAIVAAAKAGRDPTSTCAEVRRLLDRAEPNRAILAHASDRIGVDLVAIAMATFAYTRTTYNGPDGERAGLCVLFEPGEATT